jgi:IMP dehydrogenase
MKIRDYMSTDVRTVQSSDTIDDVADKMESTGFEGFPVCSGNELSGYVTALDIVGCESNNSVEEVMQYDYPVARPDIKISSAGRVMFRKGISEMLVVENGELVGLVTNQDIIRSQIERTTPSTVNSLKDMLERIHDKANFSTEETVVDMGMLRPTQGRVFSDELEGRVHELRNGLAEPIVVVDTGEELVLADGHHRSVAAHRIGMDKLDAYVISPDKIIELGMLENAKDEGLRTLSDVEIDEDNEHPLIQKLTIIEDKS